MSPEVIRALRVFEPLPLRERWFVRARIASAPLEEVAARVPPGKVLDVGCGHGALVALLASSHPVVGVDPDPRKLTWARASVGRLPNVELYEGTGESLLPALEKSFDSVAVADVLYLLPSEAWLPFLRCCHRLLRPGGALLLKEAEADNSWRYFKCLAQEALMVRLLRKTHSSGGLGFRPREHTLGLLGQAGFVELKATSLARGYSTPHVLFEALAA